MLISELTVYDFLKDKIKLPESDAKHYAKEIALAGEKSNIKVKEQINTKFKESDLVSESYLDTCLSQLETSFAQLETRCAQLEIRFAQLETGIEKGNKEVIIWIIGLLTGIIGIAVAIIKLF